MSQADKDAMKERIKRKLGADDSKISPDTNQEPQQSMDESNKDDLKRHTDDKTDLKQSQKLNQHDKPPSPPREGSKEKEVPEKSRPEDLTLSEPDNTDNKQKVNQPLSSDVCNETKKEILEKSKKR